MTTVPNPASWCQPKDKPFSDIMADLKRLKAELGPPPPEAFGCNRNTIEEIKKGLPAASVPRNNLIDPSIYGMVYGIPVIEILVAVKYEVITGSRAIIYKIKELCDKGETIEARIRINKYCGISTVQEVFPRVYKKEEINIKHSRRY